MSSPVREIRIYVEGGGNDAITRGRFREGMGQFLGSLRDCARRKGIRWQVIASGGRQSTFEDFQHALTAHPNALNVLLVDAEGTVTLPPWRHLKARDGWSQPVTATDEQCYLMIQTMEAWLIADRAALAAYYGRDFNASALPGTPNVETIDKPRLESILLHATRHTTKGEYHKIRHGTELLKRIDPAKVRAASPHCEKLFATLEARMGGC